MDLLDEDQYRRLTTYYPNTEDWIRRLPEVVAHYTEHWRLSVGPTYRPGGDASWTAAAVREDGTQAVIKIALPDPQFDNAVTALLRYDGRGAIRLYESDPGEYASLFERCEPGTTAVDHPPARAEDAAVEVLPQLWSIDTAAVKVSVPRLSDVVSERAQGLHDRGDQFEERLFHQAADLLATLAVPTPDDRLLHGDLNQRNVLRSTRGWLAIDPRPMFGDPAYDLALWLVNRIDAEPDPVAQVSRLAARLDLPRERSIRWLAGQTIQLCSWLRHSGEAGPMAEYERAARRLLAAI